jgi:hypothetical protein
LIRPEDHKNEDPSGAYAQGGVPVASEAVSLFRYLLKAPAWKNIVEEELMKPLIKVTEKASSLLVRG